MAGCDNHIKEWIGAGRPKREPGEIREIYCICKDCEKFSGKKCREGGCPVNLSEKPLRNMIAMATRACPIGKWS
jgi:hypothetical protein